MVTCRFIGRLGNNMFQMAAVMGYAHKWGVAYHGPVRCPESPRFYEFFPDFPIKDKRYKEYHYHQPQRFNYSQIPFSPSGLELVGFFQSLKYFKNCEKEVKEKFKLNIVTGYEDHVSIHVRRGDYVRYASDFPPITMEYINQAISHFKDRKTLIFSDDIVWCQQNIQGGEYPQGNEFEDLSLMASCGDHIIANSTFSWWGAYLGINPDKKIISPHFTSWFGRNNGVIKLGTPPKDIIPKEWIQIKFR